VRNSSSSGGHGSSDLSRTGLIGTLGAAVVGGVFIGVNNDRFLDLEIHFHVSKCSFLFFSFSSLY
jgi:hypothetical protein